jgi:hypothetical protein
MQSNYSAATATIIPCTKNSYQVYKELHRPEHVYADSYLIFEKIMELGIKDLYYKGTSPSVSDFRSARINLDQHASDMTP